MNMRQMVFPLPQGQATLAVPEDMTNEAIETLEQASVLMLRTLKRGAHAAAGSEAGAAEYDSWTGGVIEYESWTRRFR